MRKRALQALLAVTFLLAGARPADADMMAIWRWWDSLSGPGPFTGVMVDTQLFTYGFKLGEKDRSEPRLFFDPRGLDADESRGPSIRIGVQWGVLHGKNELPYEGRPAPGVWAIPISGTVDVATIPGVDVGGTVGFVRFTGDDFGFWRAMVTPRVIISPAALFSESPTRRQRAFQITVSASGILGTIDAADFGAVGDFKGGNEILWGTSVSVNLLALK